MSATLGLAHSIYEKFILLDDDKIVKTIRKVFIIYQNKLRKLKLNNLLKWRLLCHKLKFKKSITNTNTDMNANTITKTNTHINTNFSPKKSTELESDYNAINNPNVYIKKKSQNIPSIPTKQVHTRNVCNNNKKVKYNFEETESNRGGDSKKASIRDNFFSESGKENSSDNNRNMNRNKQNSLSVERSSQLEDEVEPEIHNKKNCEIKNDEKDDAKGNYLAGSVSTPQSQYPPKCQTPDSPPLPIHEKLYQDKKRRDIIQTELERNFRYEEIKHCTFTPKKSNYSTITEYNCPRVLKLDA